MTRLRIGTRGSALARAQTAWVAERLAAAGGVTVETVVIRTHGDADQESPFGEGWPVGAFVSALERALLAGEIDVAVHSYKDLQTAATEGLTVAAVPVRAVVHDVLITAEPCAVDALPDGFRVGTSSPRRGAQMRRLGAVEVVPIRGNVQTRMARIDAGDVDGVVLAGAGLERLGLTPAHVAPLPVDRCVPAPAQGALAVQVRGDDHAAQAAVSATLHDADTAACVRAERAFLAGIQAGCHTPVGALAHITADGVALHAQLFDDAGERMVEARDTASDPDVLGRRLADQLLAALGG